MRSPSHQRSTEQMSASTATTRKNSTGASGLAGKSAAVRLLTAPANVISASARTAGGSPLRFHAPTSHSPEGMPLPSAGGIPGLTVATRPRSRTVLRYTPVSDDRFDPHPVAAHPRDRAGSLLRLLGAPARAGGRARHSPGLDLDRIPAGGHQAGSDSIPGPPDHDRHPGQLLGGARRRIAASIQVGLSR